MSGRYMIGVAGIGLSAMVASHCGSDLCRDAADHLSRCTGAATVATDQCNEAMAAEVLEQSCDQLGGDGKSDVNGCSRFLGFACHDDEFRTTVELDRERRQPLELSGALAALALYNDTREVLLFRNRPGIGSFFYSAAALVAEVGDNQILARLRLSAGAEADFSHGGSRYQMTFEGTIDRGTAQLDRIDNKFRFRRTGSDDYPEPVFSPLCGPCDLRAWSCVARGHPPATWRCTSDGPSDDRCDFRGGHRFRICPPGQQPGPVPRCDLVQSCLSTGRYSACVPAATWGMSAPAACQFGNLAGPIPPAPPAMTPTGDAGFDCNDTYSEFRCVDTRVVGACSGGYTVVGKCGGGDNVRCCVTRKLTGEGAGCSAGNDDGLCVNTFAPARNPCYGGAQTAGRKCDGGDEIRCCLPLAPSDQLPYL